MTIFIRSIQLLLELLEILIIIRVFMNIFRISTDNIIGKTINDLTEPIVGPSKALLDKIGLGRGMIDFSPWIAILIIRVLESIIMRVYM